MDAEARERRVELFSRPLTLRCGGEIVNRLAKSAMSEAMATIDNRPTDAHATLYCRWAEGRIGLCVTGNVMIDRRALGEPRNVVIEDRADLPMLRRWAEAGSRDGTRLWMQINHPGKQAPRGLNAETVAPSAVPFRPELRRFFNTPRELREPEIEEIVGRFGRAAAIAKEAGFGGVQIHGAHGYLVSQFLSPRHNVRADRWGGSPEHRRRFVVEVYREIRRNVGDDYPVGIKLNSADFQRGGFTEGEALDVVAELGRLGIDLIEVSGGSYEAPAMSGVGRASAPLRASTLEREAYFLAFAEQARARLAEGAGTPIMVTGGFRSAAGMAAALESGAVDLVGLARPLAVDPDLPRKLLSGHDVVSSVAPISTGIEAIDRAGLLEVTWYARQLRRMGRGEEPVPDEDPRVALVKTLLTSGLGALRTRLRA
jgi:2,4-dienoyl-CoA reductase-like NADH-dependent reductase (Old Yellow Enzyme family)